MRIVNNEWKISTKNFRGTNEHTLDYRYDMKAYCFCPAHPN